MRSMHLVYDVCDTYMEHDEGLGIGVFAFDNAPLPHPFCRCTWYTTYGEQSLDDIAKRIGQWENGGTDNAIDNWAAEFIHSPKLEYEAMPTAEASLRYLNKVDTLAINSQKIPPIEGYEDIVVHGSPYGFSYNYENDKSETISAKEFAEIVKSTPGYHGGAIRLISCETASEGAIAAQLLANELGVTVMAPNDLVYVSFDGRITIGPDEFTNTGKWVTIEPKEKEGGNR